MADSIEDLLKAKEALRKGLFKPQKPEKPQMDFSEVLDNGPEGIIAAMADALKMKPEEVVQAFPKTFGQLDPVTGQLRGGDAERMVDLVIYMHQNHGNVHDAHLPQNDHALDRKLERAKQQAAQPDMGEEGPSLSSDEQQRLEAVNSKLQEMGQDPVDPFAKGAFGMQKASARRKQMRAQNHRNQIDRESSIQHLQNILEAQEQMHAQQEAGEHMYPGIDDVPGEEPHIDGGVQQEPSAASTEPDYDAEYDNPAQHSFPGLDDSVTEGNVQEGVDEPMAEHEVLGEGEAEPEVGDVGEAPVEEGAAAPEPTQEPAATPDPIHTGDGGEDVEDLTEESSEEEPAATTPDSEKPGFFSRVANSISDLFRSRGDRYEPSYGGQMQAGPVTLGGGAMPAASGSRGRASAGAGGASAFPTLDSVQQPAYGVGSAPPSWADQTIAEDKAKQEATEEKETPEKVGEESETTPSTEKPTTTGPTKPSEASEDSTEGQGKGGQEIDVQEGSETSGPTPPEKEEVKQPGTAGVPVAPARGERTAQKPTSGPFDESGKLKPPTLNTSPQNEEQGDATPPDSSGGEVDADNSTDDSGEEGDVDELEAAFQEGLDGEEGTEVSVKEDSNEMPPPERQAAEEQSSENSADEVARARAQVAAGGVDADGDGDADDADVQSTAPAGGPAAHAGDEEGGWSPPDGYDLKFAHNHKDLGLPYDRSAAATYHNAGRQYYNSNLHESEGHAAHIGAIEDATKQGFYKTPAYAEGQTDPREETTLRHYIARKEGYDVGPLLQHEDGHYYFEIGGKGGAGEAPETAAPAEEAAPAAAPEKTPPEPQAAPQPEPQPEPEGFQVDPAEHEKWHTMGAANPPRNPKAWIDQAHKRVGGSVKSGLNNEDGIKTTAQHYHTLHNAGFKVSTPQLNEAGDEHVIHVHAAPKPKKEQSAQPAAQPNSAPKEPVAAAPAAKFTDRLVKMLESRRWS